MIGSFHLACYYLFGANRKEAINAIKDTPLHEVYVACVNSVLNETQTSIRNVEQLSSGAALVALVDTLWPASLCAQKVKESGSETAEGRVQTVLDYLTSIGVKHSITAQQIVDSDLGVTSELLWLVFLHLCVHTPKTLAFQRNGNVARRLVLNWCRERLPSLTTNHLQPLVYNLCTEGVIIDLLSALCTVKHRSDSVAQMKECLTAVQREYDVLASILDAEKVLTSAVDEEILLIYIAILRRKVKAKEAKAVSNSTRALPKPTLVVMRPEPPTRLAWTV